LKFGFTPGLGHGFGQLLYCLQGLVIGMTRAVRQRLVDVRQGYRVLVKLPPDGRV
jgi:hypothetical protein